MFIKELSHNHHPSPLYMSISELSHIIHLCFTCLKHHTHTIIIHQQLCRCLYRTLKQALFTYFFYSLYRHKMAEILPIRRKTLFHQLIYVYCKTLAHKHHPPVLKMFKTELSHNHLPPAL